MNSQQKVIDDFKWYYNNGYITARDGNAAYRVSAADEYVVTGSGVKKHDLILHDDFVLVNGKSEVLLGSSPSIETGAHVAALNSTGKNASVHVHSPNTVALAALFQYDGLDFYGTHKLVKTLNSNWPELFRHTKVGRIVPFLDPGSKELHESVLTNIANSDIVIMDRHGVLAIGDTLEQCMEHIVRLEHVSGILLKIVTASNGNLSSIL